jgi:RNA polymerase sigma-70 factor (ECF subfamily)
MNPSMVLPHAAALHADQCTDRHADQDSAGETPPAETGTRPAFRAVYAEYFRAIWRTLRRLGVEGAQLDDAVQDVVVVVHRRLAEFDGRSLRGWLYAIAVRVASDYRRGTAQRRTVPLPETLVDPAPDPVRARELGESVRLLHELLAELDEPKRTVFVLGELEELSAPEIADALGENLNTVYARLRAARARFDEAFRRRRARDGWRAR